MQQSTDTTPKIARKEDKTKLMEQNEKYLALYSPSNHQSNKTSHSFPRRSREDEPVPMLKTFTESQTSNS